MRILEAHRGACKCDVGALEVQRGSGGPEGDDDAGNEDGDDDDCRQNKRPVRVYV